MSYRMTIPYVVIELERRKCVVLSTILDQLCPRTLGRLNFDIKSKVQKVI